MLLDKKFNNWYTVVTEVINVVINFSKPKSWKKLFKKSILYARMFINLTKAWMWNPQNILQKSLHNIKYEGSAIVVMSIILFSSYHQYDFSQNAYNKASFQIITSRYFKVS